MINSYLESQNARTLCQHKRLTKTSTLVILKCWILPSLSSTPKRSGPNFPLKRYALTFVRRGCPHTITELRIYTVMIDVAIKANNFDGLPCGWIVTITFQVSSQPYAVLRRYFRPGLLRDVLFVNRWTLIISAMHNPDSRVIRLLKETVEAEVFPGDNHLVNYLKEHLNFLQPDYSDVELYPKAGTTIETPAIANQPDNVTLARFAFDNDAKTREEAKFWSLAEKILAA